MDEFYNPKEPLIKILRQIIHLAVRLLAILMTLVIIWGVIDVGWVLYKKLMAPPFMILSISDILATFGAFMAVLIAIEIFINIIPARGRDPCESCHGNSAYGHRSKGHHPGL